MLRFVCLGVLFALSAIAILPGPARAEGALAIGLPADTAKDGFAFGMTWNHASRSSAETGALRRCRTFQEGSEAAKTACRIIQSFTRECVAVALDPKVGVTGEGWAVRSTRELAERAAMDRCRETARPGRQQFCMVTASECDTK